MHVLKHVTFEIEEAMHIHSNCIDKGEDPYTTTYLKLIVPYISAVEMGSFIVVVTPLMTVDFKTLDECTLSSLEELDFNKSPLPLFPYIKHITG